MAPLLVLVSEGALARLGVVVGVDIDVAEDERVGEDEQPESGVPGLLFFFLMVVGLVVLLLVLEVVLSVDAAAAASEPVGAISRLHFQLKR